MSISSCIGAALLSVQFAGAVDSHIEEHTGELDGQNTTIISQNIDFESGAALHIHAVDLEDVDIASLSMQYESNDAYTYTQRDPQVAFDENGEWYIESFNGQLQEYEDYKMGMAMSVINNDGIVSSDVEGNLKPSKERYLSDAMETVSEHIHDTCFTP
tara:strand:+ start:71 stop:544 length:474 start_codon:yes stop_codon:yes gene_type:complete